MFSPNIRQFTFASESDNNNNMQQSHRCSGGGAVFEMTNSVAEELGSTGGSSRLSRVMTTMNRNKVPQWLMAVVIIIVLALEMAVLLGASSSYIQHRVRQPPCPSINAESFDSVDVDGADADGTFPMLMMNCSVCA